MCATCFDMYFKPSSYKERFNKIESKGKNLIKEDFCIDMPDYSLCTGRNMWHDSKGTF